MQPRKSRLWGSARPASAASRVQVMTRKAPKLHSCGSTRNRAAMSPAPLAEAPAASKHGSDFESAFTIDSTEKRPRSASNPSRQQARTPPGNCQLPIEGPHLGLQPDPLLSPHSGTRLPEFMAQGFPNGVRKIGRFPEAQPRCGWDLWRWFTQGRSLCLRSTLGWMTQRCWR